jgi:hypothetical protein
MGSIMQFIISQSGIVAVILCVFIALGMLIFALFKAAKPYKWVLTLLGDLSGQPARPGVPARPGLMERQATTEAQLTQALGILEVHTERLKELEPNHGGSIKDHVSLTQETVSSLASSIDALNTRMDRLDTSVTTVNINTKTPEGTEQ